MVRKKDFLGKIQLGIIKDEIDTGRCERCGRKTDLTIHHKLGWNEFPELRYEKNNCMLLCIKCHVQIHQKQ